MLFRSNKSQAKRLHVGCALVENYFYPIEDKRVIIHKSYNHMPLHMNQGICENEIDGNLVTKPELMHAEFNCIIESFKKYARMETSCLYVTDSPCIDCAKLIHKSGIKRVVYSRPYRIMDGINYLKQAGIEVVQI